MLHLAGPDVQDLFLTLPNTADVKDYRKAYFAPKVDSTYARHCFRQLVQAPGETIRPFATRLRRASNDCHYGEDTDNQISDEILGKCSTTPHRAQCDVSSTADAEDSVQHEIKVGRKD